MAQRYTYQRHFEIDNSPDEYTHIVMEVAFRESQYMKPILIDASQAEAFYKTKNSSDAAAFIKSLGLNVETWRNKWVTGFFLHIYPIKKSAPEYGTMLIDQRSYYLYGNNKILPLGETDENKAVEISDMFINKDMWIFLAPAPRFQVTLMRQIKSQLDGVINSQLNVVPNAKTRVLGSYDIDISNYREYISPW